MLGEDSISTVGTELILHSKGVLRWVLVNGKRKSNRTNWWVAET